MRCFKATLALLVFAHGCLAVNLRFWEYFNKKDDKPLTPVEVIQTYDRDNFTRLINETRTGLNTLSDRLARTRDSIDYIRRDGNELANIIREVIEYNEATVGAISSTEEKPANATNNTSNASEEPLDSPEAGNSTKEGENGTDKGSNNSSTSTVGQRYSQRFKG